MKHIKLFNEAWYDSIITTPKNMGIKIKEKGEEIFNRIFERVELIDEIYFTPNKNECLIKFKTFLKNDLEETIEFSFLISYMDSKLFLRKVSGSSNIDAHMSFKDMNLPYNPEDVLEESLEYFANKLKPFVEFLIDEEI